MPEAKSLASLNLRRLHPDSYPPIITFASPLGDARTNSADMLENKRMFKSLRNFFFALGLACYFTSGGVAIAKNAESWLAPVCYHDLPEYGNYRWNCLVPPPPVPDDYPASVENEVAMSLPEQAEVPDDGQPPVPAASIEQPVYFSATDIRRRDWWTPTFVVNDSPLVTPPVVDESCHTQWYGCEEEAIDSYEILEAAMLAADSEEVVEPVSVEAPVEEVASSPALIPAECVAELMVAEWMLIQETIEFAQQFDLAVVSGYAADAIATTAPWIMAKPMEIVVLEDTKTAEAIVDDLFSTETNADIEAEAVGFTAYTCMIPYSLTASAEESPANYAQQSENATDMVDDRVETAAAMQKLARQLDWVGLNILRVADHLDSWANQALLRHRPGQIR